jgi:hypothetical protein
MDAGGQHPPEGAKWYVFRVPECVAFGGGTIVYNLVGLSAGLRPAGPEGPWRAIIVPPPRATSSGTLL